MSQVKSYGAVSLRHMNEKGLSKIIGIINRMGYSCNVDFKINYSGGESSAELVLMHPRLKKDLKLMGTLQVVKTSKK